MTEPVTAPPAAPDGPPPTRDALNALTVDELADTYDVPRGRKADMVAAVLERFGVPEPKAGQVVLAVDGQTSDSHTWAQDEDPIVASGTAVPASKADEIIRQAAAGGVRIYEVN